MVCAVSLNNDEIEYKNMSSDAGLMFSLLAVDAILNLQEVCT